MTQPQGSALLAAALAYAQRGLAVFPLRVGGKEPLLPSAHPGGTADAKAAREACRPPKCGQMGHGLWDATTDPDIITRWWTDEPNANIGIATGLSHLLVVDIDVKGGKPGAQTLAELESQYGKLPRTHAVRTWSGGWHYYFRMPAQRLRNTTGTEKASLGAGIDIRGDGGYVAAVPSYVYEDGKEGAYSVLTDAEPAELPEWVSEKLAKPKSIYRPPGKSSLLLPSGERASTSTGLGFPSAPTGAAPDDLRRRMQEVVQEIADLQVGDPATQPVNDRALWLGHYVPHYFTEDEIRTALTAAIDTWADGHDKGYRAIETGLRDGMADPREWQERQSFTSGRTGTPEPGQSGLVPQPSDPMATGRFLVNDLWTRPEGRTLVHYQGSFLSWAGPHWGEITDAALRSKLYRRLEHAEYNASGDPDKTARVPWHPNRDRIRNLIEALAAIAYIQEDTETPSWLSGQGVGQGVGRGEEGSSSQVVRVGQGSQGESERVPQASIIACTNGLLNVTDRTLMPLTPRYFNRVSVPFAYDLAAPVPSRWMEFLDSIWGGDPECVQALQEWFGYVVSGRTDLQKILYVVGPKRAGKGTIESALTALVGEANRAPFTCQSLATDFGLATLIGKTLAVDPDVRQTREGSETVLARLLSISGEDPVSVKRKYKDDWTGKIPARLMLMSNNLPSFKDPSGAITSRLIILTMTKSFLGKEDVTLKAALVKELPGILNWALVGLDRLEKRGRFTEPQSSEGARGLTEDGVSSVKDFVDEMCVLGDACEIEKDALYDAYKSWIEKRGGGALSNVNFAKELYESVRVTPSRPNRNGKRIQVFSGIDLSEAAKVEQGPLGAYQNKQWGSALTTLTGSGGQQPIPAGQGGWSGLGTGGAR